MTTTLMTLFSTRTMAALCALVLSATMVVGAVGPAAFDGTANQTAQSATLGNFA